MISKETAKTRILLFIFTFVIFERSYTKLGLDTSDEKHGVSSILRHAIRSFFIFPGQFPFYICILSALQCTGWSQTGKPISTSDLIVSEIRNSLVMSPTILDR